MAEKQWTIAIGDAFNFEIVPVAPNAEGIPWSDAGMNGVFATKLEALDDLIAGHEQTRAAVSRQIARAKRMRARLLKRSNPNG